MEREICLQSDVSASVKEVAPDGWWKRHAGIRKARPPVSLLLWVRHTDPRKTGGRITVSSGVAVCGAARSGRRVQWRREKVEPSGADSCIGADNMAGLWMFKGRENYSFEMDEKLYLSRLPSRATLSITSPLAMCVFFLNAFFFSFPYTVKWAHYPLSWTRSQNKIFMKVRKGWLRKKKKRKKPKQKNNGCYNIRITHILQNNLSVQNVSVWSARERGFAFSAAIQHLDTDQTACLVTVVMPNYQNQPSASLSFGMQLMIKATKSFPPAHAGSEMLMMQRICQPFCTNIMIGLMRAQSPVWMADKLEARFSFTHQS